LYLYIANQHSGKFDGIIGFADNEENDKLMFSGYLDPELNNLFDKGESISLFSRNTGDDNPMLNLTFGTRLHKLRNPV
jgi:hypothetical protein